MRFAGALLAVACCERFVVERDRTCAQAAQMRERWTLAVQADSCANERIFDDHKRRQIKLGIGLKLPNTLLLHHRIEHRC
jgi:hypothetical protein